MTSYSNVPDNRLLFGQESLTLHSTIGFADMHVYCLIQLFAKALLLLLAYQKAFEVRLPVKLFVLPLLLNSFGLAIEHECGVIA